jgi:glycosyltransferase involved in cell wall biosynthesis
MNEFSVIIVNFNKDTYLQRVASTVRSLSPDVELILADDHSNDGSFEWAEKSGVFNKIYRKENREEYCLCTVRNEGVKLATKKYVVILDADCLPESSYFLSLSSAVNSMSNPKFMAVGFTDHYTKDGKTFLLEDPRKAYLNGKTQCNIGYCDAFGGNVCFPVELWHEVGGFDQDFNGYWGYEDLEYALRCEKAGANLISYKGMLVRHLQHPLRSSIEQSVLKGRNHKLMLRKHPDSL